MHEDEADRPKLPLDAVVVRAGVMDLEDLRDNARTHYDRVSKYEGREEWALSVNSIPGLSAQDIAKRTKKRNRQMCISSVGRIEALDCVSEVRPDWTENGHSNIVLHAEPSWDDLTSVKAAFSDPVPNPGRPE